MRLLVLQNKRGLLSRYTATPSLGPGLGVALRTGIGLAEATRGKGKTCTEKCG